MERRRLGRSGISVSRLALGAGQFGTFGQTTAAECISVIHAALDGGINAIDTADFYSFGESETIVGKAIAGRRADVVLATKCGMPMGKDPNERGASRRWIRHSIEQSLRRLGTDHVDLYQIHRPDPDTDIAETLLALADLAREGKIRAYGLSNFPAHRLVEAQLVADRLGVARPHTEQPSYSIFARGVEADVLPVCVKYDVAVLAYSPLDGGWLAGKYRAGSEPEKSARQRLQPARFDLAREWNRRKLEAVEALVKLADEAGLTLPHLAIGFVLAHAAVASAIVGGSKVAYVAEHLAGKDVTLPNEVLDRIDAIVAPGTQLAEEAGFREPSLSDPSLARRVPSRRRGEESTVDRILAGKSASARGDQ
jgi:aryl-alcohol dehydrogenase-like predicted oxidoreductase